MVAIVSNDGDGCPSKAFGRTVSSGGNVGGPAVVRLAWLHAVAYRVVQGVRPSSRSRPDEKRLGILRSAGNRGDGATVDLPD